MPKMMPTEPMKKGKPMPKGKGKPMPPWVKIPNDMSKKKK